MPPSIEARAIRFLPLGGLGEIGMNCFAIEHQDGILVVDCGAAFPQDDVGLDIWHPDFSFLEMHPERVLGVFLTHGHEDHIGGLPYLLDRLDVPIWGPPHALELAKRRLSEHDYALDELDLTPTYPGEVYRIGPFEVEPVRVAHSIVEATALCIRTDAGTVVHTGDFNFDPDPPDGEPTDEARLAAIGARGVDLLLSDSTNADVPEPNGGERDVAAALERVIAGAEQRVVLALFASNVQRLISIGEIARRTGRKIALFGRSLTTNVDIARQIRRLHWPSDLVVPSDRARDLPRHALLALAGGTQAERNSALRRLSLGDHHELELEAGDTVVLSSRVIPGNERPVFDMKCDLLRRGMLVVDRHVEPMIHTSGHATRAEQRRMIELTRPKHFVPVHGTLHHLRRHAELAEAAGVPHGLIVECGTAIRLDQRGARADGPFPFGRVPIAVGGERIDGDTLRQRVELGRAGCINAVLVTDAQGRVVGGPRVTALGVPALDGAGPLRDLEREAARAIERARSRRFSVDEEVRRALRRAVLQATGTRPTIDVQLVGVDV